MELPRASLKEGCYMPEAMEKVITQAEIALRDWIIIWTEFLSPRQIEQYMPRLNELSDLKFISHGGYKNAERRKIAILRDSIFEQINSNVAPDLEGIAIEGNFLFDNPSVEDFRKTLVALGLREGSIGDIFINGDKGAKVILEKETGKKIIGKCSMIKDVPINLKIIEYSQMIFPAKKKPKIINSFESSKRLDSIASAGFGISRSKIYQQIKEGLLSLNWEKINQPSLGLESGDKIQHITKGSLEVLSIQKTKRERWKIQILRT
tara:strand:+ start:1035 stop:1826 length:792 start_codon:yes stop_codon:yes gene_type:complete